MCGRYFIEESFGDHDKFEALRSTSLGTRMLTDLGRPIKTFGEMAPTDIVPVYAPNSHGEITLFPMVWGFSEKSLVINARSETAADKYLFSEGWKKHRCIIPASWYFEWSRLKTSGGATKKGEKYIIQPKGMTSTWMCGLYRIERGFPHFVILTRTASESVLEVHDRMPLILPYSMAGTWTYPDTDPNRMMDYMLTNMSVEKELS